jgi:hypothetical protein
MALNDWSIAWRSVTKDSPLRPLREAPAFVVLVRLSLKIRIPFLAFVASSASFARGFLFASFARGSYSPISLVSSSAKT